jgi:hypothetical protein
MEKRPKMFTSRIQSQNFGSICCVSVDQSIFFVPKLVHQERHEEIHTRRTQPGAPLSKACAWGLEEQVECTLKLTMQKVFLLTQDI